MKKRIFITGRVPQVVHEKLSSAGYEVDVWNEDCPVKTEVLLEKVKISDAVVCMLSDSIDASIIAAAREGGKCRAFANFAVGYNNIDISGAKDAGIYVTNTPDVLTAATADIVWALLLATARRVVEGDQCMRSGKFNGWQPLFMLGCEVSGKTIGIMGAGRIGQAVAERARGFDMRILYSNRTRKTEFEQETGASYVSKEALLQEADFVSLNMAYVPELYHYIAEKELRMMKNSAILLNAARGQLIDENILVRALSEGWIAGAGLDVYEKEPLMADGLKNCNNAVLVPHLGSATLETRDKMGVIVADNIIAALNGEIPRNNVY